MPRQLALSRIREVLGARAEIAGPLVPRESWCRGLDGMDGGADDAEDDEVDLTTIVSTVPMTRAASVSSGPRPLFRDAKKGLCLIKLLHDIAGLR